MCELPLGLNLLAVLLFICHACTLNCRASLNMAQASAFLIPSPSQGILTIQDTRSAALSGLVDMVPPSFSPGLPGGFNCAMSVATGGGGMGGNGGGHTLNFFPGSSSSTPRQQSGPQVNVIALLLSTVFVVSVDLLSC